MSRAEDHDKFIETIRYDFPEEAALVEEQACVLNEQNRDKKLEFAQFASFVTGLWAILSSIDSQGAEANQINAFGIAALTISGLILYLRKNNSQEPE